MGCVVLRVWSVVCSDRGENCDTDADPKCIKMADFKNDREKYGEIICLSD